MRHNVRKEDSQEAISMEEYLNKRQKIKEAQKKKTGRNKEKNPAWAALMWAALYV